MFPAGKGENVPQVRTISKTTLQKDDQEVMPSPTVSFREEENPKNPNFLAFVVDVVCEHSYPCAGNMFIVPRSMCV